MKAWGQAASPSGEPLEAPLPEGQAGAEEEEGPPVPAVPEGASARLLEVRLEARATEPPPRYTDASLVRTMEELGIGRPSTYAPT
ncbi:DNA topoisomerase, partial [Shewanella sp. C31]|nr:DNA topoisomerase [Shewanella electrica]